MVCYSSGTAVSGLDVCVQMLGLLMAWTRAVVMALTRTGSR